MSDMKYSFLLVVLTIEATVVFAQSSEESWGFNTIPNNSVVNQMSGPRFGFTYVSDVSPLTGMPLEIPESGARNGFAAVQR